MKPESINPDHLPLSLYVHWPWCVQKCPYCDFNSHVARSDLTEQYAEALWQDWHSQYEAFAGGRQIASIFFGGGTPSLASPKVIEQLIERVSRTAGMTSDVEITIEANPGTVDEAHFAGYFTAGVNRLSLGVQSFDNDLLARIGRIHDRDQVFRAIEVALNVGFTRLNLDLMTGLPTQTLAQAVRDIETAVQIAPEHLSLYQLTLEPNTPFFSRPPEGLPDEDLADDLQMAVHDCAQSAGYERYEVSAWAKSSASHSRHNLNYWTFGDYLGIGAGAHGKITTATGEVIRTQTHKTPQVYVQDVQAMQKARASRAQAMPSQVIQSMISAEDLPFEFLLNALRLTDGVSSSLFPERTGLARSVLSERWQSLVAEGLVTPSATRLATTAEGYRHLNAVLSRWLG